MKNNSKKNDPGTRSIELRSEKVRNIIGQTPPMLLRHGTIVIVLVLLVIILISAFTPYEETIPISLKIKTIPQIHEIRTKRAGLFIPNKKDLYMVKSQDTIGYFYHADSLSKIVTSFTGKIIFNLQNKHQLNLEELICIIIPVDSCYYYGEASILKDEKNKLSINQKVVIQYSETKDTIGSITEISRFSGIDNKYKVLIKLDNDNLFYIYKELEGKIIISETTILQRIIKSLNRSQ